MKYRIKEQHGVFHIEEEYEYRDSEYCFLAFIGLKKPIMRKRWKTHLLKFKSFNDAVDYIPKIEPKYHSISELPTFTQSVDIGLAALSNDIKKIDTICPNCTYFKGDVLKAYHKVSECEECKIKRNLTQ